MRLPGSDGDTRYALSRDAPVLLLTNAKKATVSVLYWYKNFPASAAISGTSSPVKTGESSFYSLTRFLHSFISHPSFALQPFVHFSALLDRGSAESDTSSYALSNDERGHIEAALLFDFGALPELKGKRYFEYEHPGFPSHH